MKSGINDYQRMLTILIRRMAGATLLVLPFLSACTKGDGAKALNGWVINDTTYDVATTANKYQYGNYHYALTACSSAPEGNIYFVFSERPQSSGTYRISSEAGPANCVVNVFARSGRYLFQSTGNNREPVRVTVSHNKLRIKLPKCWVVNKVYNDSFQVSAGIGEK